MMGAKQALKDFKKPHEAPTKRGDNRGTLNHTSPKNTPLTNQDV
jgi:hypothetical protein